MWKHLFLVFVTIFTAVACGKMNSSHNSIVAPLSQEEDNLISDMYDTVSKVVDSIYKKTELRKERIKSMNHYSDSCFKDFAQFNTFAEMQNYFILKHLESRPAQIHFLSSYYQVPSDIKEIYPTSLMSHEFCSITKESLSVSLQKEKVPDQETINQLNELSKINNQLRSELLAKPTYDSKLAYSQHWAKLTKCLSYIESLSTADSAESKVIAERYAPSNYRKPAGIGFYEDPRQPIESRLNIGIFQFTPDIGGNIQACVRQWNSLYPSCSISLSANQSEMIRVLGSELQAFNTFCGINKIHQTFSVQVNSNNPKRTHVANNTKNRLKNSNERCVSINFFSTYAYNHFGPFQNSTGKNLKELMSCYFK